VTVKTIVTEELFLTFYSSNNREEKCIMVSTKILSSTVVFTFIIYTFISTKSTYYNYIL